MSKRKNNNEMAFTGILMMLGSGMVNNPGVKSEMFITGLKMVLPGYEPKKIDSKNNDEIIDIDYTEIK